ncbi:MAG: peptide-methionine (S)-S-oxide reductase MsrA [Pirellulaceae bacterium]
MSANFVMRIFALFVAASFVACAGNFRAQEPATNKSKKSSSEQKVNPNVKTETATFGNGCFWCTEAVFDRLKGVESVTSGYSGGAQKNPTYEQVCSGRTGHAEVVQIVFDPQVISYDKLLEVFWSTHDPTTLNQQGPDRGTQYRSAVFYHNEEQQKKAEYFKAELEKSKVFDDPIVTEIVAFKEFYPAEKYHQEYFASNPTDRYCQIQAVPKIKKIQKLFADLLKDEAK